MTLLKKRAKHEAALGAPQYWAQQSGFGQTRPEISPLPADPLPPLADEVVVDDEAGVTSAKTPGKSASCLQAVQRSLRGWQSLNLSASSMRQVGTKPQVSSSSSRLAPRANRDLSSPRRSASEAAEAPSIGSHRREMGGRIWLLRYHSMSGLSSPSERFTSSGWKAFSAAALVPSRSQIT